MLKKHQVTGLQQLFVSVKQHIVVFLQITDVTLNRLMFGAVGQIVFTFGHCHLAVSSLCHNSVSVLIYDTFSLFRYHNLFLAMYSV